MEVPSWKAKTVNLNTVAECRFCSSPPSPICQCETRMFRELSWCRSSQPEKRESAVWSLEDSRGSPILGPSPPYITLTPQAGCGSNITHALRRRKRRFKEFALLAACRTGDSILCRNNHAVASTPTTRNTQPPQPPTLLPKATVLHPTAVPWIAPHPTRRQYIAQNSMDLGLDRCRASAVAIANTGATAHQQLLSINPG